ncbi:hypothetical protein [Paenibacillus sp. sgz500958]|uniref:hypothetical protein n=1 Tax=Paenibacillus sp. sgz500958 TaxID=3242475 RepID=UPI0036D3DA30
MNEFLKSVGMISIAFAIMYIYKRIVDHAYLQEADDCEDIIFNQAEEIRNGKS